MTNQELTRLNQRQAAAGLPLYKNTRNVAAGTIRLLDPQLCAQRRLRFFCHGTGYCEGWEFANHGDFLKQVSQFGLVPTPQVEIFPQFDQVLAHCEAMIERLGDLDFEVDGIVIKVNDFQQRRQLGIRSKSPRWVTAYKWEKYEAVTRINGIQVQVGKTGTITPVAELEPVELAGTTVSRASLHNAREIERKDIRIGDWVVVEKAGKIIPHVVRVELARRPPDVSVYGFPDQCPVCGTAVVQDEGGVYVRCPNLQCPAQLKERIRYFATRGAMDIEGLGEKLVEQLVDAGLVQSYGDLYRLTAAALQQLPRMGQRSSEKLVAAIDASRTRGLARLLNALSIRHVGANVAELLAEHFGRLDALQSASLEQLEAVGDIGPAIAASVFEYFQSESGQAIVQDLRGLGLVLQAGAQEQAERSERLVGATFVVTGTLPDFGRDEIQALIKRHGGKASSSISSKTSYVIAGENAGSKLEKAQQLGIPVIDQAAFLAMIQ